MTTLIQPYKSDGTQPAIAANGDVTLGVGTYFFPVRQMSDRAVGCAFLRWDNLAACVVTFEDSPWPDADVTDYGDALGDFVPENPTDAYVAAVGGAAVSGTQVTVTAGQQGGCSYHLSGFGAPRARLRVVTSVGGVFRCGVAGKER